MYICTSAIAGIKETSGRCERTISKNRYFRSFSEDAKEAERLGVSYMTAGHIYVTDCKKGLAPRGLGFLKDVCSTVNVPVYAIGGIKFDEKQWEELKQNGASGGCIMSGMMEL